MLSAFKYVGTNEHNTHRLLCNYFAFIATMLYVPRFRNTRCVEWHCICIVVLRKYLW